MKKRLISVVILTIVVIVAATVYLWFREVPLQVRISDIAFKPRTYDGKLVEVEGRLIRYEFGFWTGYGLTDGITEIALSGYEKQIINGWVGPFDQHLDKYVVITGRVEYMHVTDVPRLYIKISKLTMSS